MIIRHRHLLGGLICQFVFLDDDVPLLSWAEEAGEDIQLFFVGVLYRVQVIAVAHKRFLIEDLLSKRFEPVVIMEVHGLLLEVGVGSLVVGVELIEISVDLGFAGDAALVGKHIEHASVGLRHFRIQGQGELVYSKHTNWFPVRELSADHRSAVVLFVELHLAELPLFDDVLGVLWVHGFDCRIESPELLYDSFFHAVGNLRLGLLIIMTKTWRPKDERVNPLVAYPAVLHLVDGVDGPLGRPWHVEPVAKEPSEIEDLGQVQLLASELDFVLVDVDTLLDVLDLQVFRNEFPLLRHPGVVQL
mmetsp:Transcript_32855/g.50219  ORF Transcript_32855/g.50219 Transcript_32855/m.50219 type:complete len:303 (-) Transcript_32855:5646-6554(-)